MCLEIIYLTYMYKKDLTWNNLQGLMCHKTKLNQTRNYLTVWKKWAQACLKMLSKKTYLIYMYKEDLAWNNQQGLICDKAKLNQTKPNQTKTKQSCIWWCNTNTELL